MHSQSNAIKAVIVLSEVLESFAYHFVEDKHYGVTSMICIHSIMSVKT